MEELVILIGTIDSTCNILIKRILEEKGYSILCFVDSYNKGAIVDNVPVIALDDIVEFTKDYVSRKNLKIHFLFPLNTSGRKEVFKKVASIFKNRGNVVLITYPETLKKIKEDFCKLLEKNLPENEKKEVLNILRNTKKLNSEVPELINLISDCFSMEDED